MLPAEEEVEDDFEGRSGDDFQSLKNINVPVPTKPQPLLPGSIFFCSLGGTPGSLFIMIPLYFGGTQLVYPEKMKNTASSVTVNSPCGCRLQALQLHKPNLKSTS